MIETAIDILLVEDNRDDIELTIRSLKKKNLANNLFVVTDGEEALNFLRGEGAFAQNDISGRPRLILLDIKLPKVDGIEVLRQIKSSEQLSNIPVVMLTSSRETPDIEKCYRLGVNSYIVKPVDFDKFVDAVGSLGMYWLLLNEAPH